MRILRYVSDLHLELRPTINHVKLNPLYQTPNKSNNDQNYLALLGDIGNPYHNNLALFFDRVSPCYETIFYIPGNHEYYNLGSIHRSKDAFDDELKSICSQYHNIIYMNNNIYELDDIKIIGSTLWTHISDDKSEYIMKAINDYHLIKDNDLNKITTSNTNEWHDESLKFIEDEISSTNKKCIVLTHHAPLFNNDILEQYTAHPKYTNSKNDVVFHNDLSSLMKEPVVAWLYGHTHHKSSFKFNNVTIATNQLGYSHEENEINFNSYAYIDLNKL